MIAKPSVFVNFVEAIIYLLLYDLHDCSFKVLFSCYHQEQIKRKGKRMPSRHLPAQS